jgi:hypothetical protein
MVRQAARRPVQPYWREGWRHPLDGPYELPSPVTTQQLRELEAQIREVLEALRAAHPKSPLYFPFQLSDSRPIRAFQGYLTKFPRALIEVAPQLSAIGALAAQTQSTAETPAPSAGTAGLGSDYRAAKPHVRTAKREPFSVDPDLVDRALKGHAETQDALADAVRAAGLVPRSPRPGEPAFDIAWDDGDEIAVAEIKTLTKRNEEKQLHLALGQVHRYGDLLSAKGRPVRRVIGVERRPSDISWIELCARNNVRLVWPATFTALFAGE